MLMEYTKVLEAIAVLRRLFLQGAGCQEACIRFPRRDAVENIGIFIFGE